MSTEHITCRTCLESKPGSDFYVYRTPKKDYPHRSCKACKCKDRRTRRRDDDRHRVLHCLYSMETAVKRKYPEAWRGPIRDEGIDLLLNAPCCHYCKHPNDGTVTFSLDHYHPLALGGLHTLENLRPACWPCNAAKMDMPPEQFVSWLNGVVARLSS